MNQSNNNANSNKTIQSMSDSSTATATPTRSGKIIELGNVGTSSMTTTSGNVIPTVTSTVGTKTNPLYMKRQTSFKEFIFSLFPFLFIFWMLGGFDLVRNRKQAGVGGMFGSNYSEWDEEDWEDDDEMMDDDDTKQLSEKQKEEHRKKKEEDEARKKKEEEDEMDKRTSFFKKLGIDLSSNKDDDKQKIKQIITNNKYQ